MATPTVAEIAREETVIIQSVTLSWNCIYLKHGKQQVVWHETVLKNISQVTLTVHKEVHSKFNIAMSFNFWPITQITQFFHPH